MFSFPSSSLSFLPLHSFFQCPFYFWHNAFFPPRSYYCWAVLKHCGAWAQSTNAGLACYGSKYLKLQAQMLQCYVKLFSSPTLTFAFITTWKAKFEFGILIGTGKRGESLPIPKPQLQPNIHPSLLTPAPVPLGGALCAQLRTPQPPNPGFTLPHCHPPQTALPWPCLRPLMCATQGAWCTPEGIEPGKRPG